MTAKQPFLFVRRGKALHPSGTDTQKALETWPENILLQVDLLSFAQTDESRHFFALCRQAQKILGFQGEDLFHVLKGVARMFKKVEYINPEGEKKIVQVLDNTSTARIGQKKGAEALLKLTKALDALLARHRKGLTDKKEIAPVDNVMKGIEDLLSKMERPHD